MRFYIKHADIKKQTADCYVIPIFIDRQLSTLGQEIDELSTGFITKILKNGDLTGENGQNLLLYEIPNLPAKRVLLLGCGKKESFSETAFRKALTNSVAILKSTEACEVVYSLADFPLKNRDLFWKTRLAVETITEGLYVFDQFKSKKEPKRSSFTKIIFTVPEKEQLQPLEKAITEANAIVNGVNFTKFLGNLPANVCTPTYMEQQAKELAKEHSAIKTIILDKAEMKELGMNSLLAVASGSHEPPKLIVVEYSGAKATDQPVLLVGKGVTFDTGGISLKPPPNMDEMKFDMCGAASVLGTIKTIAELKLPVNVVGIMPTTENMPGGQAVKPGDIVTSMSGQTIEILNTDAEGRLILADALTYGERYNPAIVIDIATLTGAIIVALGSLASGLMSNSESLTHDLMKAADKSGDRLWPLPLWEDYQELLDSNVADMANIGDGNGAKSIVAGCFLERFAKKYVWAHLDVAGTANSSGKKKSATGRPVPLLVQYLLDRCESM